MAKAHSDTGRRLSIMVVAMMLSMGLLLVGGVAAKSTYSKMVVLGDSLSDTGNAFLATHNTIPPSPPYFEGRFSNGEVWVEMLAADLGLSAKPFLAPPLGTGTNLAFGSAQTPGLLLQASLYLASHSWRADPQALYVVWGGASDVRRAVREAVENNIDPTETITKAVRNTAKIIVVLAGARHFLIPNMGLFAQRPKKVHFTGCIIT